MNNKKLITLIHVAKSKLNLSDENYKNILMSVSCAYGVRSAKDSTKNMSDRELKEVIKLFETLGFTSSNKIKVNKSECVNLSYKQVKYIKSLWRSVANIKTDDALNKFLERTTKKNSLSLLNQSDAHAVIVALKKMYNESKNKKDARL